ncbi:MAG: amidase [Bacteroidota bacterium]
MFVRKLLPYYIVLFSLSLSACKSPKAHFSKRDVKRAQKIAGVDFENPHLKTLYPYLLRNRDGYDSLRKYSLDYRVSPALSFDPRPKAFQMPEEEGPSNYSPISKIDVPRNKEEIAFYTIPQLHALISQKKISSVELTQLYLDRLKKHDQTLFCVISLTEELALRQARKADSLLEAGTILGPLHGIPYGLKDLIAVKGYPTTWGAFPYQEQAFDHTATIAKKLEAAGAVLLAKLTSGALARGDVWFGGKTRNPWDTEEGAGGSSAGSGSATAAGLVGFSIGTETLGSITSPSTRNGITGLRPTYGRVSREGVMSLSWSMDKVGPMCRSVEGCALVFETIAGEDSEDPSSLDAPFQFEHTAELSDFKVGYLKEIIENDSSDSGKNLKKAISLLEKEGVTLIPKNLPDAFPFAVFDIILRAEAGAFFDELVRSGQVDEMVQQSYSSRATSLRQSRFIPAVEYLQANRYRSELIEAMHELMKDIDILITPTFGGRQLIITNLTGHPVVCVPGGLDKKNHPTSISFLGNLYEEGKILEFAHIFQQLTDFDQMYPPAYYPTNP